MLKRFYASSIRRQLAICFSILITLLVVCVLIVFQVSFTKHIINQHQMENRQIALHISKEMDSQIENLEAAKRQFLYSSDTMNRYAEFLRIPDAFSKSNAQNSVMEALYRVLNNGVPQIFCLAVHGKDGSAISAYTYGKHSLLYDTADKRMQLLSDPAFSAGTTITPPFDTAGGPMICMLVRFISPHDHSTCACLEIQQRYSEFERVVLDATRGTEKNVLIYDDNGNVIYPLDADQEDISYYESAQSSTAEQMASREHELIAFNQAKLPGWTVVVTESEHTYQKQIHRASNIVVLLGIAALAVCLYLVIVISHRLTLPLTSLQNEMQQLALESLTDTMPKTNVETSSYNEYENLKSNFDSMRVKLQNSISSYLELEKQNSEAQLLALQSKMHPHFINNVLASIEIMSERGEREKVVDICRHLSGMLTYSMQDYDGPVPLCEEIRYAVDYVELMKIRYPTRLTCDFEVEESCKQVLIPKMMIQPLIENSIKHAMRPDGLHVQVVARGTNTHFSICVIDNGKGFQVPPASLLNETGCIQNNLHRAEHGIGLRNIYQRLHLYYGNDAEMQISSDHSQTIVMIGKKEAHPNEENVEDTDH